MNSQQSAELFAALFQLLTPYAARFDCTENSEQSVSYNTHHVMKNKKSLFFAAVKINKNYVSFHLMPVYVFPELLSDVSPSLRKRMHGKSCFNFRTMEELSLQELESLVATSINRFEQAGYLEKAQG